MQDSPTPEINIEKFKEKHKAELTRLEKLLRTMHSVSDIRFLYNHLRNLSPVPAGEIDHEYIMLNEAIITAIVMGYGRLFSETEGTTQLNKNVVPEHLFPIHKAIMSLRQKRYAHHGAHETINTNMNIESDGKFLTINPQLEFLFCFGAPAEWEPLFKWIDEYMFHLSKEKVEHLSKVSGIECKIPSRPAPHWICGEGE